MPGLPEELAQVLDGEHLDSHAGFTMLLLTDGVDGWPHSAALSVGEVLAVTPEVVHLMLYAASRTSQALAARGRGVLVAVVDGALTRVRLEVASSDAEDARAGRRRFRGRVVAVEIDRVAYARVTHGIEFELLDTGARARWRRQIDELRGLES